ncbi:unnamed protein product [Discosporangium mesarthrocarpum]
MAEWTHPRKASKETISYLTQIEPVVDQYGEEVLGSEGVGGEVGDGEDEDVDQEQMLDNVLDELKHQTASIMEDRHGSVVAEKIARRVNPLQLRVMISRCRGYMLSLANNRYSSHVLQTLLSLAGRVVEAELVDGPGFVVDTHGDFSTAVDLDEDVKAARSGGKKKKSVDLMQDIILSLVSEISGSWSELMADISGSHTGRAFIQVLGGLPVLAEKRGRESRHQHSIETAHTPSGRRQETMGGDSIGSHAGKGSGKQPADPEALKKWSASRLHRVPSSFLDALGAVVGELLALPQGDLLSLACTTFGCPLVVMVLRVYANLAVDPTSGQLPRMEEGSPAMELVAKILDWGDEERSSQVVYAMSGEGTGSILMEAVIWLSPRGFFKELYTRCFEGRLYEYCEHEVSNYLVQACLHRVEDKPAARAMVDSLGPRSADLLTQRRGGVLWRAAQACARLDLGHKTQASFLAHVSSAVRARGTAGGGSGVGPEEEAGAGDNAPPPSPSAAADLFKEARDWVPALLEPRLPGGKGNLDQLYLNVTGARIVQNMLAFEAGVSAPVVKAVASLPEETLVAVAKDNLGSRCLLDPILEGARAETGARGGKEGGKGEGGSASGGKGGLTGKAAEDARRMLLRCYRGNLVSMACDRVAWHVLLKLFRRADMKGKSGRKGMVAHVWLPLRANYPLRVHGGALLPLPQGVGRNLP